ncbi:MAG: M15 family metallopeptidase [Cellulomonas sp.]|uniref:M15 family metallopeptidase n=1 Tax=Cellulomonas sp. TaxID=40001 RepID=UPI001A044C57|nr:M15 family metallopeptidase [Cellulomonas sp.]MBF0686377.1 M15 family metallopeptidase [Cellulomonas sp.]
MTGDLATTQVLPAEAVGPCPDVPVPPEGRPRLLRTGAVHPAVRDVQRRLNALAVPGTPLTEDCVLGPRTAAAVRAFQVVAMPTTPADHDGVVGPRTWAALDAAAAPGRVPPRPVPPAPPGPPPPAPSPPGPVPAVGAAAGRREVATVALLRAHGGAPPDLVLRWTALPAGATRVDVVVHLHGYSGQRAAMRLADKERIAGLDWQDPVTGTPGRATATLAVLPRGRWFGGAGGDGFDFPALARPGALDDLVQVAVRELASATGLPGLTRGRLVLTAHSGGGAAVERVLAAGADPDEIHLFDTTYGTPTQVRAWAARHVARDGTGTPPASALRVLWHRHPQVTGHATAFAAALASVVPVAVRRWYRVEETTVEHGLIPRTFGWRLLADAGADVVDAAGRPLPGRPGPPVPAPAPPAPAPPAPVPPGPPPAAGRARTTAELRAAWAAYRCADALMVRVRVLSHTTPVNPLAVDAYAALDAALRATGYRARRTWAYTCRSIAGTTVASLHSYGTAVDVDPAWNPHRLRTTAPVRFATAATVEQRAAEVAAGTADTVLTPEQVAAVEAVRTREGHRVWAWGGRWRTSHDSMHFQVDATPAELAAGIDPATVPTPP